MHPPSLLTLLFLISHFFETVHEYWRNSTSYIASCHPLILLITHLETGDSNIPAYAFALRLMATISCPSIKCILLYRLGYMFFSQFTLSYLFCYLLLRNGWHSSSLHPIYSRYMLSIQQKLTDSNPLIISLLNLVE